VKLQDEIRERLDAAGASPTGDGGAWITYGDLAEELYGTPEPARHQRDSIGRACRTMAERGEIEIGTTVIHGGARVEVQRTGHYSDIEACTGDTDCQPCRYGNRARDGHDIDRDALRHVYRRDETKVAEQLERAELFGVHRWTDFTSEREFSSTGHYAIKVGRARRLPTDEELEVREQQQAQRAERARAIQDALVGGPSIGALLGVGR
jgi:hypothetical protein